MNQRNLGAFKPGAREQFETDDVFGFVPEMSIVETINLTAVFCEVGEMSVCERVLSMWMLCKEVLCMREGELSIVETINLTAVFCDMGGGGGGGK